MRSRSCLAEADVNAQNTRLLVITPLRIERAAVRRGLPEALVLRSGIGAVRARSTAMVAARIPADAVAVAGFCGAVVAGLHPGDVVVASEVRGPAGVTGCASGPVVAALAALGIERIRVGPVASVDHLVRGAERRVLADEGALAVDMESAWLAPAAAGRPFVVLRVVLDTPAREIHRPVGHSRRWPRGLAGVATGGARAGALRPAVRRAQPLRRWHWARGARADRSTCGASPRGSCRRSV